MGKDMLINMVEAQECRIAIVGNGELEELYIERSSSASHVGNIYKGRVTNVEPSIQAAFIDFGGPKNGFLHISDVHPQHFPGNKKKNVNEAVGQKRPHRERPPIQECLRRGQEVTVQMTKEGIGTKGPTMTTYLSIPGRLLVMMPGMTRLGVSRKIEDPEARSKARDNLGDLKLPNDMGFIVRTAGIGHTKRDMQRDLNYLLRLWKSVKQRISNAKAPAEIYQESNLVIRTIRDVYNSDIDRIICDTPEVAEAVKEFLDMAVPRTKHRIKLYQGKRGLFHEFGLEQEIEKVYSRRVELKSGGSLIVDQAEALVAIDINSGKFKDHKDAETTALKINQEAASEILRQLRLRDLGGVIVIDFIDMRHERNRRAVEKIMREGLKKDRAKTKLLRMSSFGIVELTRQRVRPSLKHSMYRECKHCAGLGLIKSEESQALLVLRNLQRATAVDDICRVEVSVTPEVAHHLANFQRQSIAALEKKAQAKVIVQIDDSLAGDDMHIVCKNNRGSVINWEQNKGGKGKPDLIDLNEYQKQQKSGTRGDQDRKQEPRDERPDDSDGRQDDGDSGQGKSKRRRGRRGGRKHKRKDQDQGDQKDQQQGDANKQDDTSDRKDQGGGKQQNKKKRSSRSRSKKSSTRDQDKQKSDKQSGSDGDGKDQQESSDQDQGKSKRPSRRRRSKKSSSKSDQDGGKGGDSGGKDDSDAKDQAPKKKSSRRRSRKKSSKSGGNSDSDGNSDSGKGDND
jgi:ribonuclease E